VIYDWVMEKMGGDDSEEKGALRESLLEIKKI
jgi:hypothetical protein